MVSASVYGFEKKISFMPIESAQMLSEIVPFETAQNKSA